MYIERFKDDKGHLLIKYPLINNLKNDRGWRATPETNERYARSVVGTALTLMLDKEESKYKDFHPFLYDDNAPVKDQIEHAYRYAIGVNVDVTNDSGHYKGASGEIPWFGIADILDPVAKAELEKPDTKLIPPGFSPGILHISGPDDAISEYHIVHVAAVPAGAYGPKFIQLAKCSGDAISCVSRLKSAASYKERTNHLSS